MVKKHDNAILFDWFSFTSKIDSVSSIISMLGLYDLPFLDGKGAHGFKYRKYFEGISIHYERDDGLVWLEMSGGGCRAFETYSKNPDWNELFKKIVQDPENYHITRLDIAYDDFNKVLNQDKMFKAMQKNYVVTKFRDYGLEHISFVKSDMTLFFGSNKSDIYIRIYNKAAERGREDDIPHWVRFELQLRNDRAFDFINNYILCDFDIGLVFLGVVNNYLRFVDPSADSNKSRWNTSKWWLKFINDVDKINLYSKKDLDYNESKLQNYVFGQAGQAINCALDLYGVEGFSQYLDTYLKQHRQNKNPKYDELVERLTGGTSF